MYMWLLAIDRNTRTLLVANDLPRLVAYRQPELPIGNCIRTLILGYVSPLRWRPSHIQPGRGLG